MSEARTRADEAFARANAQVRAAMERVDRHRDEIDRRKAALLEERCSAGEKGPIRSFPHRLWPRCKDGERCAHHPPCASLAVRFARASAVREAYYAGRDFGSWIDVAGTPLAAFRVSRIARARLDLGRLKRRLTLALERWREAKRLPPPSQGPYR